MLQYQNLAQTDYKKDKAIPSANPLQRPKENPINQQPTPVPQPFNTLLPTNLFTQQDHESQKSIPLQKEESMHQSIGNQILSSPQEQMLFDKQQELMSQSEDLKSQNKRLISENQQLKQLVNQIQPELQTYKNQKSNEHELRSKIEYLEEMTMKLKSENRRQTQTIQDQIYKLQELDNLKNKLEQFQSFQRKLQEQEIKIKEQAEQLQEQKRQLAAQQQLESDNHLLKDYIDTYKQQLREKDIQNEQQKQLSEQQFLENKKLKSQIDMQAFEIKKNQEQYSDQLHRKNLMIADLQAQENNVSKTLSNQAHQIDLQKQQIQQLELKEKELYQIKNQNLKINEKLQFLQQQNFQQMREIEKLNMTLTNGKQEYLGLQNKCTIQDQEIKKLNAEINQNQQQKFQIAQQYQSYELEVQKRQGNLELGISKANQTQAELIQNLEITKQQLQNLEQELQKKDILLHQQQQQIQTFSDQINQLSQVDQMNKAEINANLNKMREMHSDLIQYEKQCDHIQLENNQIKMANQMMFERNEELQREIANLREQIIKQDNRIRSLENELHNISFQQKLNATKIPYLNDPLFPSLKQLTPSSSFNQYTYK